MAFIHSGQAMLEPETRLNGHDAFAVLTKFGRP
jgi:hypothetical protein